MRTILSSSGRDYVLFILFQVYGAEAGIFESNLFWVDRYTPFPQTFILEEELILY